MRDNLRTRMGWLHGWVGFIAGLPLTIIFAAGTLSTFDIEIGRWMQPEIQLPFGVHPSPGVLSHAENMLWSLHRQGVIAFLNLPSPRDPALRILHYDGQEFVGPALDPRSGQVVPARETVGGNFFYNLHFTLLAGHDWGRRIVDTLGLAMLVAIGSGIVIHWRSIIPDIVLFRPFAARPRAWMDAHILAGVLFLPFITATAYTGVVVHSGAILPDGGVRKDTLSAQSSAPENLPPLAPMIIEAERVLGDGKTGFILFGPDAIHVVQGDFTRFYLTRDEVAFDYRDGHLLHITRHGGAIARSQQAFRGLHYIRWAPLPIRWLYFLAGLTGAIMMASGLVLFLMRYRRQHGGEWTFHLAEGLTMAVVLGFPVATLSLFWLNRLLPPFLPHRALAEFHATLDIWLFTAVHAFAFSLSGHAGRAWRQQAATLGMLAVTLPLLDLSTRDHGWTLPASSPFIAVDTLAFLVGILAWHLYRRLSPEHAS
ncbi:putative iron-regulated membrane protein [Neoasaia chiangmaiensis NBRC 101099]|uniref:Uncharacterized protein n=1 Tax=Neoasaia chiangmaiensis TaxID=320497 RepID=A0A1U9KN01_9PROT|nr:PepSY-associated TM helix domain-containing protein [Neoasaia chiangmaiensis]AQS87169.1 hypothetical protein A0U93_03590 [Neoasaia chiangmaiensis]GBR38217.1 putative iron-regulated membrane protein [Neoasaia chiangmaiensis NBRC 101099]GEN15985.1 iron uptake protein [Neoasaia chiangmaiensis]